MQAHLRAARLRTSRPSVWRSTSGVSLRCSRPDVEFSVDVAQLRFIQTDLSNLSGIEAAPGS